MVWLALSPLNVFAFIFVVISLLQAESCLEHSECVQVSSRRYCCRGRCITSENRTKGDNCFAPSRTNSTDDFIIIGVCSGIAVVLVIIICPRCPCFKCRSPKVSVDTVARCPVHQTPAALKTITFSSLNQMYPETGVPQEISLQEPVPYLPASCTNRYLLEK